MKVANRLYDLPAEIKRLVHVFGLVKQMEAQVLVMSQLGAAAAQSDSPDREPFA